MSWGLVARKMREGVVRKLRLSTFVKTARSRSGWALATNIPSRRDGGAAATGGAMDRRRGPRCERPWRLGNSHSTAMRLSNALRALATPLSCMIRRPPPQWVINFPKNRPRNCPKELRGTRTAVGQARGRCRPVSLGASALAASCSVPTAGCLRRRVDGGPAGGHARPAITRPSLRPCAAACRVTAAERSAAYTSTFLTLLRHQKSWHVRTPARTPMRAGSAHSSSGLHVQVLTQLRCSPVYT